MFIPAEGDFERVTWLLSHEQLRAPPSVGHFAEERLYGRGKFKVFSDISRPLEAMARCFEPHIDIFKEGKSSFCTQAKFGSDCSGMKVIFVAFFFGQRSTVEVFLVFFLIVEKPKH